MGYPSSPDSATPDRRAQTEERHVGQASCRRRQRDHERCTRAAGESWMALMISGRRASVHRPTWTCAGAPACVDGPPG
jgi:hypothetical protein